MFESPTLREHLNWLSTVFLYLAKHCLSLSISLIVPPKIFFLYWVSSHSPLHHLRALNNFCLSASCSVVVGLVIFLLMSDLVGEAPLVLAGFESLCFLFLSSSILSLKSNCSVNCLCLFSSLILSCSKYCSVNFFCFNSSFYLSISKKSLVSFSSLCFSFSRNSFVNLSSSACCCFFSFAKKTSDKASSAFCFCSFLSFSCSSANF